MKSLFDHVRSLCSRSVQSTLVFLIAPFILLIRSWGLSAVYAVGLVALALAVLDQMNTYLLEYMRWLDTEPSFPNWLVPHFQDALTTMLRLLILPVPIVASLLPLRLQYHSQGRVPISRLLSETLPSLLQCARGICSLLRAHYRVFIPFFCLSWLLHLSLTVPKLAPMKYFYLAALIGLFVVLIQKALSLLLGPILIVVGDIEAELVLGKAAHVLRTGYVEVSLVLGLGVSLLVTTYSVLEKVNGSSSEVRILQASAAFFILWYVATLLGLICLRRTHLMRHEQFEASSV